jgi:hypothetical protein
MFAAIVESVTDEAALHELQRALEIELAADGWPGAQGCALA